MLTRNTKNAKRKYSHFTWLVTFTLAIAFVAGPFAPAALMASQNQTRARSLPQSRSSATLSRAALSADIKAPTVTAKVDPASVRVNRRQPIPFVPFKMVDPKTGKSISRATKLPPLPNGKVVTAGQYYDELNRLERQFNAMGYSLRGNKDETIELQESVVPRAILEAQDRQLKAQQVPNRKFQKFIPQAIEQEQKAFLATQQNASPAAGPSGLTSSFTEKTVHKDWNWSKSLGNPKYFAINIKNNVDLVGQRKSFATGVKIEAESKTSGTIFNHNFDLVRVTGQFKGVDYYSQKDVMSASLGAYVLGYKVYNLNKTANAGFTKSDTLSKNIDKSVKIYFSLGPIPMSAKIGAQGSGGIKYGITVSPLAANVNVGPFVKTKVYAQVGVDIVVAGAGVGANMVLLNYEPTLKGSIAFGISPTQGIYFNTKASLCHEVEALKGKLYVYAYIQGLIFNWKKQWEWTIWDWKGFEYEACVFDYNKNLYI